MAGQEGDFDLRAPETYKSILSGDLNQNGFFDDELDAFHVCSAGNVDSTAILDGFSISMGNAVFAGGGGFNLQNRGGGIIIQNGSPIIRNCFFSNNKANFFGGAISNLAAFAASNPTIENCSFEVNFCLQGNGGAIHNEGFGAIVEITVTDCFFMKNQAAENGGAFYGNVLEAQIDGCKFQSNFAQRGGAIYTQDFIIIDVRNTLFNSNFSEIEGGAVHNATSTIQPSYTNCVLSGNAAPIGAAMLNRGADAKYYNCTVSGNFAEEGLGGGIANFEAANATIKNSIFWKNMDGDSSQTSAQIFDDSTSTSDLSYSIVEGGWTGQSTDGNNNSDDPLFVEEIDPANAPTEEGDFSLQEGSPAINAGNNEDVQEGIETDIVGADRIQADTVDLGAYEFEMEEGDDNEETDSLAINCMDISRSLDMNGQIVVFAEEIDGGLTGAEGNVSLAINNDISVNFDCDDIGVQIVTLSATDEAGNTATCEALISIMDDLAPTVACKDIEIELDINNQASIDFTDITSVIDDNCGLGAISLDQSQFNCDDIGENLVEVVVSDINGNTDSCLALVTVTEIPFLPSPWESENIGGGQGEGFYSECQDAFVLSSDGFNASPASDALQFVFQEFCASGEIIARVREIDNPGFAGIAIRESNSESSRKVEFLSNNGSFVYSKVRTTNFGGEQTQLFFRPGHIWFRMQRFGPFYRGFSSTDGISWIPAFQAYLPGGFNTCVEVGIMVHSTTQGEETTAIFDNVSISSYPSIPYFTGTEVEFDNDGNISNQISVYPNPTADRVFVDLPELNETSGQIEIFNAFGQLVYKKENVPFEGQLLELNLANLSNGVYQMRLHQAGQMIESTSIVISR